MSGVAILPKSQEDVTMCCISHLHEGWPQSVSLEHLSLDFGNLLNLVI